MFYFALSFDKYSTQSKRLAFIEELIQTVQFIEVIQQIDECRDPKDNKYLELTVNGNADYIQQIAGL